MWSGSGLGPQELRDHWVIVILDLGYAFQLRGGWWILYLFFLTESFVCMFSGCGLVLLD